MAGELLALRADCGEDGADAETSLPERCVVSLRDRFTGRQCSANKSAPPYTRLIAIVLRASAAAYAVAHAYAMQRQNASLSTRGNTTRVVRHNVPRAVITIYVSL